MADTMPRNATFAPVQIQTLKDSIAEMISDAIFTGKIKPGDRLNESQLARELKVSRAPIREALQQLEEQGLIVNHPRRGMFVVNLEDEDLQKINSLRLIIEAEALRLARANLTPAAANRLGQMLERMERSEDASPNVRVRLDFDFHKAIWALTGNPYIEKTLSSLTAPLFAYGVIRAMKSEKVRHVINSHRPLLEYLAGDCSQSAIQVLAEHLRVPWSEPERFSSYAARKKAGRGAT